MFLLVILVLSIAIQFSAALLSLLLIRRSGNSIAWVFLAAGFVLMGVRRILVLAGTLASGASAPDTISESVGLLISFLLLAGVWKLRDVLDHLNRMRRNAEEQVEKRKKVEEDLTVSLREAEEATARLRENEERLRFLGDNLDGVMLYQIDTGVDGRERRFTYVSNGVERLHELRADEVMKTPFAIYTQLSEQDRQPYSEIERVALENESLFRAEIRIILPSGKTKWLLIVSAPHRTADNHLVWSGFEVDITERKRLEEALRQQSETLEKAVADRTARLRNLAVELVQTEQRERRRLSDFLHDDLQQVLVGAKFVSDRLASEPSAEDLSRDACKLRDLLAEALDKTRALSNGLVTPLLYEVGLVPALRHLAGQMQERFGVEIACEVHELPDLLQDAVKVSLFHSVRELLFNAVKHSGTKTVRLRGGISGGQIVLSVDDAGDGFDAGGVMSGTSRKGGNGLFSVRERMVDLGGTLTVDSVPGHGTHVTLSIPVTRQQASAPQTVSPPSSSGRRVAAAEDRARVLVVDDHALFRQGVVSLLAQQSGLDVVGEAADGGEAVSLAKRLLPDVIIMDIRMPVMGGIEATRLILAEFPDIIVIGLSAFVEQGFKTEMLKAGARDLLDKASAGEMLPAKIAECLASRKKGLR